MFAPFSSFSTDGCRYLCRKFDLIDDVKRWAGQHPRSYCPACACFLHDSNDGVSYWLSLTMTLLSVAFYFLYALFAIFTVGQSSLKA